MPEPADGIQAMRDRMARASRKPPPRRRAPGDGEAIDTPVPAPTETPVPVTPKREASPPPSQTENPTRQGRSSRQKRTQDLHLAPDLPPVNLAIRVRRPLDDRLASIIHSLRLRGVRTSKVELIEMLLWELPATAEPDDALLERLGRFRSCAPRAMSSAIPAGDSQH